MINERQLIDIRRDEKGSAAVEFALVAGFLALLVAGLVDFGDAVNIATKLESAARAGAEYAIENPGDALGIKQVVRNATDNAAVVFAPGTPNLFCTCDRSSAAAVDCATGMCPLGVTKRYYMSIDVQQALAPILPYGPFAGPINLSGGAVVQVQ